TSAAAALRAVEATLTADEQSLAPAVAKLMADRLKQASDCRVARAAGTGSVGGSAGSSSETGSGSGSSSGSNPCSAAAQAVASDEETVRSAEEKVTADKGAFEAARVTLAAAWQALAATESAATEYDVAAAYTMLPSPGKVVRRGEGLYAVDGRPVL